MTSEHLRRLAERFEEQRHKGAKWLCVDVPDLLQLVELASEAMEARVKASSIEITKSGYESGSSGRRPAVRNPQGPGQ